MSKLDEIKKALQAATPGPWVYNDICDDIYAVKTDVIVCIAVGPEDGPLIANAPEWLRFLLSELDREREENQKLREERDEARSKAEEAWKEIDSLEEQLQSAQQEIERLGNLARQERELADHWMRKHHDDVVKLREEREKMIEGLRKLAKTNAENISEIREWKAKQNDPEVIDLDWYNYVARDILKEIGANVE